MGMVDVSALFSLKGSVALVTGGAQGIGRDICYILSSAGATVAVVDIDLEGAEKTVSNIQEEDGEARAYACDVSDPAAVVEMVHKVRNDHGRLDILVNDAGYQDREYLTDISVEYWDKIHTTNLRGPFLTIRETAKIMRADKTRGRIINISSAGSMVSFIKGLAAYSASKGGINSLTRNAAYELVGDGITVNAILPGGVITPGAMNAKGPMPDEVETARMTPPLGRFGQGSDIANAVLFFASPASEWVTGQMLTVDGGYVINH